MKKAVFVSLLAVVLLVVAATPSHAWRHGARTSVFIGVGPAFWWGPGPWWWYYPPPPYVYAPPPVIVQQPPVYVQQSAPGYWYYCPSAGAYYPTVPSCSESWILVAPRMQ